MNRKKNINRKKVIFRLILISLIPISILSFLVVIYTHNPEQHPSVVLAKEDKTPRISEVILPINAPTVHEIETPLFTISRKTSIDEKFNLKAVEATSYLVTFNESFNQEDALAFTTSISNLSAKTQYTVIITYNGTEIYNQQHEGNILLETTNCKLDQDFRIYILNTSSKQMKGRLNISYFSS